MFPTQMTAHLPLQLTPEQCDAYTDVAYGVRDQTIALYEAYLARWSPETSTAPAFDAREWKLLKTKEHFKIFSSRRKQHATAYQAPNNTISAIHQSAEWRPQSSLRCIGSFVGSLDEAMYGAVTATETAMMVRSLMIHDHFIDHKALCDITLPTEDDPFTHVGLKWSARPPYLATMVRPRDLTYVQATGFCTVNHNGSDKRAAFHVYHSVENVPGVPEFTEYGFRRCRFSLSVVCLSTEAGTIDVFATIASDAGGDLPRNLTTLMSASALVAIHKVMDNALQKKLVRLRATKLDRSMPSLAPTLGGTSTTTTACTYCQRETSFLHLRTRCGVCDARVCKRCITTQSLVLGRTKATLRPTNVATCRGCLDATLKMDVRALAVLEFVRPFHEDYDATDSQSHLSTGSISSYFSSDFTGSFFGRRDSSAFFSIGTETERSSSYVSQPSLCGSVRDSSSSSSTTNNREPRRDQERRWAQFFHS